MRQAEKFRLNVMIDENVQRIIADVENITVVLTLLYRRKSKMD